MQLCSSWLVRGCNSVLSPNKPIFCWERKTERVIERERKERKRGRKEERGRERDQEDCCFHQGEKWWRSEPRHGLLQWKEKSYSGFVRCYHWGSELRDIGVFLVLFWKLFSNLSVCFLTQLEGERWIQEEFGLKIGLYFITLRYIRWVSRLCDFSVMHGCPWHICGPAADILWWFIGLS